MIALGVLGGTQAAIAEDTTYSWTGAHVGIHLGYGFGGNPQPVPGFGDIARPTSAGLRAFYDNGGVNLPNYTTQGILGGLQAGYSYQSGNFVVGLEADWSLTDISGSRYRFATATNPTYRGSVSYALQSQTLDWLSTVRARAGYANANFQFYGTGGLAIGRVTNGLDVDAVAPFFTVIYNGANSETKVGWTAGVGGAYGFGRWQVKLEYLYYDLGTSSIYAPTTTPSVAAGSNFTLDQKVNGHIVRTGLNFKF